MHFLTEYVIEFTGHLRTYYTDIFCRKTLSWLVKKKAEKSFKSTNFITSQSFSIFNEKMYTVSGCLLLHDNGCVVKYHVDKPGRCLPKTNARDVSRTGRLYKFAIKSQEKNILADINLWQNHFLTTTNIYRYMVKSRTGDVVFISASFISLCYWRVLLFGAYPVSFRYL